MNPVGVQCNARGKNPCNCYKEGKCTRKTEERKQGICWMEKGECEYQ